MSCTDELGAFELETLKNMEREGIRDLQFRSDDDAGIYQSTTHRSTKSRLKTKLTMIQMSNGQKNKDGHTSLTPVDGKRGLGHTKQFSTLQQDSSTRIRAALGHSIWPKRLALK